MNRRVVLLVGVVAIFLLLFLNFGFNSFSFIMGAILSFIYALILGSIISGRDKCKKDAYFANKYDEEYGNKRKSK